MKLLLDTHIFLWINSNPEKLSSNILDACHNSNNQLYLCVVSPWEIQIKQQLGKLRLHSQLSDMVDTQVEQNELPHHHKDPFDRLLISQTVIESMTLVTVDKKIGQYDIETLGISKP